MIQAREPFQFVVASYLTRICREKAAGLSEFAGQLHSCSEASVFFHTFQSLERQHYTSFSNDFAQWVLAGCNEAPLAEQLTAIDIRDCTSIGELRNSLTAQVDGYLRVNPAAAGRIAFEPFYFCEAFEYSVPWGEQALTLADLEEGIRHMSLQTLHYHFINSRLRLRLQTNDFSHWIRNSLELPELANHVDRIDIYVNTLDGLRERLIETIHPWTIK
ncbi:MAG TPA: DUF5752 family protein [Candidatus Acidoferrales bacterium]|nr:DUF5752 family protein [Candidatus Acidoferrales bacterium]